MMVLGGDESLVLGSEKEGGSGGVKSRLVNEENNLPNSNSKSTSTVLTTGTSADVLANEEKTGRKLYLDTVKAEQRSKFLRRLSILGVGTNRIEENQIKSRKELVKDTGRRVNDIVQEMEMKTNDACKDASRKRWRRDNWRNGMETSDEYSKSKVQKIIRRLKNEASKTSQMSFYWKTILNFQIEILIFV